MAKYAKKILLLLTFAYENTNTFIVYITYGKGTSSFSRYMQRHYVFETDVPFIIRIDFK